MKNELKRIAQVAWKRNPKENWERATRKLSGQSTRSDLRVATVDEWWQLGRAYPLMRRGSHTPLKDYGYLAILNYIDSAHPKRVFEFGHGLWHSGMDSLYTRTDIELWSCDDNVGVEYYADRQEWQTKYDALKAKYPNVHFVQMLLGDPEKARGIIPNNYFDLVISVSVLEELQPKVFEQVLRHAYQILLPGGKLLCSMDLVIGDIDTLKARISSVRQCGFEWKVDETALKFIWWDNVLMEDQFMIMVGYQRQEGETRHFRGNYTTVMIEAVKPRAA